MIESTTAIKGLTGLDVPSLIGGAMGRGFGERLRTGDGEGQGGGESGSAADRITAIAGEGLSTLKAARAEAAAKAVAAEAEAKEAAHEAEAKAAEAAQKAEDQATKAQAVAGALKTAGAAKVAAAADKVTAAPQAWGTVTQSKPDGMQGVGPSAGNVEQWAKWLAGQLSQVPQIQVYGALRLADLAEKGPLPARAVWQTAQAVLGKDYSAITVGDLLNRFRQ
jgi:hypothetical protein